MSNTDVGFLIVFVIGVLLVMGGVGVPWVVVQLAKLDTWWSPFRTLPPPGEMLIVVRGDPKGPFDAVVESVLDYNYDPATREFTGPVLVTREKDDFLSRHGVARVGFFRYLLHREVQHDKWELLPDSTEWGMVRKIRPGPSIFFQYSMAVEVKAAETKGNFPVDAVIVFTAQIGNPAKALFFAGGWAGQVSAAVAGRFRKYVSDYTIEQLREEHQVSGTASIVEAVKKLTDELYSLFGVKIVDARFVKFDLVSGDGDTSMLNATRAKEIARLEAEADTLRGQGESNKRKARAEGIKAEMAAWGSDPVGGTVAMAEAIKEAKPTVIGGGVIASVDGERRK